MILSSDMHYKVFVYDGMANVRVRNRSWEMRKDMHTNTTYGLDGVTMERVDEEQNSLLRRIVAVMEYRALTTLDNDYGRVSMHLRADNEIEAMVGVWHHMTEETYALTLMGKQAGWDDVNDRMDLMTALVAGVDPASMLVMARNTDAELRPLIDSLVSLRS